MLKDGKLHQKEQEEEKVRIVSLDDLLYTSYYYCIISLSDYYYLYCPGIVVTRFKAYLFELVIRDAERFLPRGGRFSASVWDQYQPSPVRNLVANAL